MIIPFAVMLLSIAAMPFINKHWWEKHYPLVALTLGSITVAYYLFALRDPLTVTHTAHEYASFIALIGSLFIVSGGIHLSLKGESTPTGNVVFLFIGSVLANLVGTTGASMLLIRPWIRMNKYRITAFHIVFFIFTISNVAGCLTPIGDPPLFLGYLRGVPFFWTLEHLWLPWAFTLSALLAVFYWLDRRNFLRASGKIRHQQTAAGETWRFTGTHNVFFLALILMAVFLPSPWREALMVGAAAASYYSTKREVHASNAFNFAPIKEVAFLFIGIFATMMPALDYLKLHAAGLGIASPLTFYFSSGILSGVLDNAPTYLTFLSAASGLFADGGIPGLIADHQPYLVAISLGAVFFGALTYIGNGPNFMVKSIAEHAKVHTPGFIQYIVKYALPVLLPILILAGWLFLHNSSA